MRAVKPFSWAAFLENAVAFLFPRMTYICEQIAYKMSGICAFLDRAVWGNGAENRMFFGVMAVAFLMLFATVIVAQTYLYFTNLSR